MSVVLPHVQLLGGSHSLVQTIPAHRQKLKTKLKGPSESTNWVTCEEDGLDEYTDTGMSYLVFS